MAVSSDLQGANLPFEYHLLDMEELAQWVWEAALHNDVAEHVERLYEQLQVEIDKRRPYASSRGDVADSTNLAIACMSRPWSWPSSFAALNRRQPNRCPCFNRPVGAHFKSPNYARCTPSAPLGCRNFFCDATSTDWQQEQYERFHGDLKRLHAELAIPYAYVEWRLAVQKLGITGPEQTP